MFGDAVSKFFRNKLVRIFLVIDAIIIVVMIALSINRSIKTATIVFNVSPIDAKITLNGQGEYDSSGTYQIYPGNYKVEISREGLNSKTFDINIGSNENTSIVTYLVDDGTMDFYRQKDQYESFNRLASIGSATNNITTDHETTGENFVGVTNADIKMMRSLPINDVFYEQTETGRHLVRDVTIRVSKNGNCATYLCIEALILGDANEDTITELLKEHKFNVENYEIQYKTY